MPSTTALAAPLLAWFDRARRELPWRQEPRDPYRVWISEVMLQQTRVDVVIPYYRRFVRRFPTLEALASAPLDEVLAHWSGLGYYARGRNLHAAAQAARARGGLPRTAAELRELPGFGPYTAAAVASLAYGEQVPLVDGNVARVLARFLRLPGDAREAREQAWKAAPELLPRGRAGAFNEALMELGATVCTPRAPRCEECPIRGACAGSANAEAYPAPRARRVRPRLVWAAAALQRADGAVLLRRHGAGELFAGLWDLPSAELPAGTSAQLDLLAASSDAREAAGAALASCGAVAARLRGCGEVTQTLTHRELSVVLYAGEGRADEREGLRWVRSSELGSVGISSLARKCLRACGIGAPGRSSGS